MSKRQLFLPNLAEKSTITCNLLRIHLTRFAIHAVWWSLTWCILLRIGGISLPPLLSRWQQLSLSILDELHEANVMFTIKWNKVIRSRSSCGSWFCFVVLFVRHFRRYVYHVCMGIFRFVSSFDFMQDVASSESCL